MSMALFILLNMFFSNAEMPQENVFAVMNEFVQENYSFGDDGIDCEIEIHDFQKLSERSGLVYEDTQTLYSFKASQSLTAHGCGIPFACYAVVKVTKKTQQADLLWGHCDI